MRALFLVLLLSVTAEARIHPNGNLASKGQRDRAAWSLFEFLPYGVNAADECTGATVTGSRGETITFTRATAASCVKTDGTVVKLSSGQPDVSGNGLHIEAAGTNFALQSEALGNGVWTSGGGTHTDNFANAPDGTMTASRYQFSTALNTSTFRNLTVSSTTVSTASAYLQQSAANPGSFASVLVSFAGGTATCTCGTSDGRTCTLFASGATCGAYITTDANWVRLWAIATDNAAQTTVAPVYRVGRPNVSETGDALFWGMQLETQAFVSSYIPTTGSSVARNATVASFAQPTGVTDTESCVAATSFTDNPTIANGRIAGMTGNPNPLSVLNTNQRASFFDGTAATNNTGGVSGINVPTRYSSGWRTSDSSVRVTSPSNTATGSYDGSVLTSTFFLGSTNGTSSFLTGYIKALSFYGQRDRCQ